MPRNAQIFCASTLYGAATVVAAIDADKFRPADRRILLVANTAPYPETVEDFTELPGFARLRDRFDDVLSWNETISPFHPGGWSTRGDDSPLWERYLRRLWKLGDDRVEIVGETLENGPAYALAQMFPDSPVDLYAAGLIAYGPTRAKLDPIIGTRARRLLYPDLVPGLKPLLLAEFGVPTETLPLDGLRKLFAEPSAGASAGAGAGAKKSAPDGPALLLGQYLSGQDVLSEAREEELYGRMVRAAVARGHRTLVFAPHPTAPVRWSRHLEEEAERLGAELTVSTEPVAAESLFQTLRPALVVGCFSTALFTAATLYGLPVAQVGTGSLLAGLSPYAAPQRIPLTLADALLSDLEDPAVRVGAGLPPAGQVADRVAGLRDAVAFCMQPQVHAALRPAVEEYLSGHLDEDTWPYFKRRVLASLVLPGAVPAQLAFIPRNPAVRRIARRAKALGRTAQG
jgi:hypothetical protein